MPDFAVISLFFLTFFFTMRGGVGISHDNFFFGFFFREANIPCIGLDS